LNSSTGEISGTPTAAGTFTFTVRAVNSVSFNTKTLSITISPSGTIPPVNPPNNEDGGQVVVSPVTEINTPATGGWIESNIVVTDSGGNKLPVVGIPDSTDNSVAKQQLADIGLNVKVLNGEVVISGTATDIGAVVLTVLLNDGRTTTVTFEVKPIEHNDAPALNNNQQSWTGTVVEWISQMGTRIHRFTLFIPLSLTNEEIFNVKDVDATISGGTLQQSPTIVTTRGALREAGESGAYIKITGTTSNPANVIIESISYRLGIDRYTKHVSVPLITADLEYSSGSGTIPGGSETSNGAGGGGGGCNAGFAGFAVLLMAGLSLITKQRMGRKRG
jgi:hypothetical protein